MKFLSLLSIFSVVADDHQVCPHTVGPECLADQEIDQGQGRDHISLIQTKALLQSKTVKSGKTSTDAQGPMTMTTTTTTATNPGFSCRFASSDKYNGLTNLTNESMWKAQCMSAVGTTNLQDLMTGFVFHEGVFLPLYASTDLKTRDVKITKAAIWMHGSSYNAPWYQCTGMLGAKLFGYSEKVLTVTPLFFDAYLTSSNWTKQDLGGDFISPCWDYPPNATDLDNGSDVNSGWPYGANSVPLMGGNARAFPDGTTMSSIEILELLIKAFLPDGSYHEIYPNVDKVTLIGFSAGSALVQRFALLSTLPLQDNVQVILGNADSYLYLNDTRPALECRPFHDTGEDHTCAKFEVLKADACDIYGENGTIDGWGSTSITHPPYNTWPGGLAMSSVEWFVHGACFEYVGTFLRSPQKVEELLIDFPKKNIKQIQGSKDYCNCGSAGYLNPQNEHCYPSVNPPSIPFPDLSPVCDYNYFGGFISSGVPGRDSPCCDSWPDSFTGGEDIYQAEGYDVAAAGCGGLMQGSNRFQRARNWNSHLTAFYAHRGVSYNMPTRFFPSQHNSTAFAVSPAFVEWVLAR